MIWCGPVQSQSSSMGEREPEGWEHEEGLGTEEGGMENGAYRSWQGLGADSPLELPEQRTVALAHLDCKIVSLYCFKPVSLM